jgi:hypothetical protein
MIRRFKFEDEVHQTLSCVPMAVRRKLDRVGVKLSLEQWQQLGRGERLAICLFIREAVKDRCGGATPKELPDEVRAAADPPAHPPALLVERARDVGITLGEREWARLDSDERYALIKLGAGAEPSHNLAAGLRELLER